MMNTYLVLMRGINVGGKNKVSMTELKKCLEELGFTNVSTYINSGNVIMQSDKPANYIQSKVEAILPKTFKLDSELIKVLVLTQGQLQAIIDNKPKGFGDQPAKYHSDVIFLMGVKTNEAMPVFKPREGVDKIWPGNEAIYSQRLSAERTKSRLNAIMSSPLYKSMTIRSWSTVQKLSNILKEVDEK